MTDRFEGDGPTPADVERALRSPVALRARAAALRMMASTMLESAGDLELRADVLERRGFAPDGTPPEPDDGCP